MSEPTTIFSIYDDKDREIRAVLTEVYRALKEKGYNPINQLVGYIRSEDAAGAAEKLPRRIILKGDPFHGFYTQTHI